MIIAAASDPEAQRWLGWQPQYLVAEPDRERLLALTPGHGRIPSRTADGGCYLIAVDQASGQLAGAIGAHVDSGEIGGWLSPRFRSRGLGGELFAGATIFVHHHLGVVSALAATEPANLACVAALRSAGFIPTTGSDVHPLPDGRVVPARWFRHAIDQPARCYG